MEKELLLLQQEFQNYKQVNEEKIHHLEISVQELDGRVKDMEMSKQKTEYQYEQIMETLKTLNETTIPNLTKQIQELKNKPIERYNLIITSMVSAVIGGIATFIINKLLGH